MRNYKLLSVCTSSAVFGFLAMPPQAALARPDVVRIDGEAETILSELSVTGNGPGKETAVSPVSGYRATRSGTATRTDTPLRDSPQSVNVVPREVLTDQQDLRLTDALQNVSNVQPAGTIQGRSDTFVIRGFKTQTYAIDGVLLNQANNFAVVTRDLADVERIEVLKGPASVLYGRGDPGGLINIVTRRPTFAPSADLTLQGGSFGFRRLQGSVSGAIPEIDGLAGRVSFALQDDPTFRNFGDRTNTRNFVAPAFTYSPSPDTRVSFVGEFTKVDSQYDEGLIAVNGRVPLDNIARYYGEPYSRYNAAANFGLLRVEHDLNENITLRQVLSAQGGGFDLLATRATGLTKRNTLVTRRDTGVASTYATVDSQSEVVAKFDLLGLRHTVLVGVEYTNGYRRAYTTQGNVASVSFLNPTFGAPPGALALQADLKQKNALASLYAQDQIELGAGFQLLLGIRYDDGEQFYFSRTLSSRTIPPTQALSGTSPRVGLIYRPVEPLTLYASYSTSFKPQTDNVLNTVNPPPETGEQYEVGSRLDILPTLTLSTAAFQITRNNVSANDPVHTGFSVITGQQRSEGVEADLAGEILPGWNVIGSVGYLDARITRDTTFAVGNRLLAAPTFSGSVWTTYQIQEGALRGLGIGAGVTYVGKRFGDLNNSYTVGAYTRVDAALYYDVDEHYRLAINARNLTNARYIEQPFNMFNNLPGAPLSVLATLTAKL
ncbi:Metal-pseudopaline receptor CntO [Methylobacterium organophilum]|uniref:Metal-pseudopaline receptor CntO n=1 Tax=Methylobacterium organophilum TaxID=410 RepID=A0ABQ4T9R1_METOR|nr:Metal-pseudopaline receptor CntO [Methylobacterium organophilum]